MAPRQEITEILEPRAERRVDEAAYVAHSRTVVGHMVSSVDEIHIRAVAYPEGEAWIAQGIEYDICAHATEVDDLPVAFMRAVVEMACITEQLGREPLAGIRPAPERFQEMFARAKTRVAAVGESPFSKIGGDNVDMRLVSAAG